MKTAEAARRAQPWVLGEHHPRDAARPALDPAPGLVRWHLLRHVRRRPRIVICGAATTLDGVMVRLASSPLSSLVVMRPAARRRRPRPCAVLRDSIPTTISPTAVAANGSSHAQPQSAPTIPTIAMRDESASDRWWYALAMMEGERQRRPMACVTPKSSSFETTEAIATERPAKSASPSPERAVCTPAVPTIPRSVMSDEHVIARPPLPMMPAILSVSTCSYLPKPSGCRSVGGSAPTWRRTSRSRGDQIPAVPPYKRRTEPTMPPTPNLSTERTRFTNAPRIVTEAGEMEAAASSGERCNRGLDQLAEAAEAADAASKACPVRFLRGERMGPSNHALSGAHVSARQEHMTHRCYSLP